MAEIYSTIIGIFLLLVSIGVSIYSAYQTKKRRYYDQLSYLSCEIKSSVFRIEGNKKLKAIFVKPLVIQIKNVGRGPAVQIRFSSDFDNIQIPNLNPGEPYEFRLPTGEEMREIDIEGKFTVTYKDTYLKNKESVYNYSIIIFDGEMKLEEIIRKSIRIL